MGVLRDENLVHCAKNCPPYANDSNFGSIYGRYKAGLFYIAKEGLHLDDWDIMFADDKLRKKMNVLLKVA